jgi:hypothetical protein
LGATLLGRLNSARLLVAALTINGQPDRQAGQNDKTKRDNTNSDNNGGIHLDLPFASNIVGRVLPLASTALHPERAITLRL